MRWVLLLAALNGACAHGSRSAENEGGCTSDLECRRGWELCQKPYNSMYGLCIATVDSSGMPVYTPPRTTSHWYGGRGCPWTGMCEVGFVCVQGICVR